MITLLQNLRNYINNDLLYQLIVMASIVVITLLLAKLFSYLIKKLLYPIVSKSKTSVDDEILKVTENTVFRVIIISGLYAALAVFSGGFSLTSAISNKSLIEEYPYLDKLVIVADYILFLIVMILLLLLTFKVINIFFHWYSNKVHAEDNKNLTGSLFPLLSKISKVLTFIIVFIIVLAKFKVDISAFVVSLGVGSLAIALAAQETLSNMISGFIVMVDRPFRIGDRVKIGNDVIGDVTEIGIRSTKIIDFDNNLIIIPNNDVAKSRIVNLSYPSNLTRVLVDVGVAYGTDVNLVKELLLKSTESNPLVSNEIKPEAFFINFGDSSLDFRLAVRTQNYNNAFQLGCDLREKIYTLFNENNVSIPFPQRDLHIITQPENSDKPQN
ncbi:MAG TPA: mechanosensitive ion channel [Ignavibacteriaceae bacterium]|nr:mechanosensitive ion channel [Ignavibacteriaceae bacterium]HPO56258.1 mechanosensitive ion channel [Ignavibacteriaceae bacterium]